MNRKVRNKQASSTARENQSKFNNTQIACGRRVPSADCAVSGAVNWFKVSKGEGTGCCTRFRPS